MILQVGKYRINLVALLYSVVLDEGTDSECEELHFQGSQEVITLTHDETGKFRTLLAGLKFTR
jgi:hypothetical protein